MTYSISNGDWKKGKTSNISDREKQRWILQIDCLIKNFVCILSQINQSIESECFTSRITWLIRSESTTVLDPLGPFTWAGPGLFYWNFPAHSFHMLGRSDAIPWEDFSKNSARQLLFLCVCRDQFFRSKDCSEITLEIDSLPTMVSYFGLTRLPAMENWSAHLDYGVDRYLGTSKPYFAAFGAASAALVGITAAYQVAKGVTTYCLAGPLALGINVREFGEWAGKLCRGNTLNQSSHQLGESAVYQDFGNPVNQSINQSRVG